MLQKSIYRHLLHFSLVLILFGFGFWYGSDGKAEVEGKLSATEDRVEKIENLLAEKLMQPNVNVQNDIKDVKVKDGAELNFVPNTQVEQLNVPENPDKQKALPIRIQLQILEKQDHLNRLIKEDRRPGKRKKLQEEIKHLRNPP